MDSGIFRQHFQNFQELRCVCKKLRNTWCQEKVSGVSYTSPPTSTSWQRLLEIISLCAHAHTPKFRKNPEKFPFVLCIAQWMHGMRTMHFPHGRFLNFVNSFGFFRSKPVPFLKIGAFAMQSDISDDPRSRSPRGSLSATTLELPGLREGRIQDEWPPRIPADYAVRPNALPVAAPAA